jgi:RNA polymerase sigma factor (sigma-70 family)
VATRMFDRRPAAALGDPQDRVANIVARHGELLTRVARGYSLCADDAQDAVQRALEIYMRRVDSLDPATELAWMKVVVKHEALAVRRGRASVAGEEIDLDAVPAVGQRSVEERLESAERVERSAEVMRRLKRDEARALMLKAEGLSYLEIGERLGWTYTKVNRCITEGRRRFMRLYEELETGAECERLAPTLVALAAGTATSEALLDLRPHLRNCPGCRATVRDLHTSRLRRLTAFLPVGLVAPARAFVERLRDPRASSEEAIELRPMERQQELEEAFRRLNAGDAVTQPVAPSVAEGVGRLSTVRINTRGWIEAALQRLQSSDVALGIHTATTGGGGRITSIAALIGICVSGVGAGTYCVATALLPAPKPAIRSEAKPPSKRKAASHARSSAPNTRTPTNTSANIQSSHTAQRATPTREVSKTRDPRRNEPVQSDEFSFEGTQATAASKSSSVTRSTTGTTETSSSDASFESGAASKKSAGTGEFADGTGGEFSP